MSGNRFRAATRTQARLRAAIDGPSGSGKTWTGLVWAHALADAFAAEGQPRIAMIDTERGSGSKYVGEQFDDESATFQFDVLELHNFSPSEYAEAIREAGTDGYAVLLVDSLSHAWEGIGGALDQVDKKGGNRFTAWKDVTPQHRAMVDAILNSPCHVIVTMRSKTEYVLEKNEKGQDVPRRVGVAPIQRAGMEYEFDVYASMDLSHTVSVSKTRCRAIDGIIACKPTGRFLNPVISWLKTGVAAPAVEVTAIRQRITNEQLNRLVAIANGWPENKILAELRRYNAEVWTDLGSAQADELAKRLETAARNREARSNTSATPQTIENDQPRRDRLRAALDGMKRYGYTQEDWLSALAKRGVEKAIYLTPPQADEIATGLEVLAAKLAETQKQLETSVYGIPNTVEPALLPAPKQPTGAAEEPAPKPKRERKPKAEPSAVGG